MVEGERLALPGSGTLLVVQLDPPSKEGEEDFFTDEVPIIGWLTAAEAFWPASPITVNGTYEVPSPDTQSLAIRVADRIFELDRGFHNSEADWRASALTRLRKKRDEQRPGP